MTQKSRILFHYIERSFTFKNRSRIKDLISKIFKDHKKKIDSINYVFCGDEYLLAINQQYLNHDTYTDIITFQLSEASKPILADIYISVERVHDNASKMSIAFQLELIRVIIHGALHLCGYKDKSKKDQALMREAENYYLSRI